MYEATDRHTRKKKQRILRFETTYTYTGLLQQMILDFRLLNEAVSTTGVELRGMFSEALVW